MYIDQRKKSIFPRHSVSAFGFLNQSTLLGAYDSLSKVYFLSYSNEKFELFETNVMVSDIREIYKRCKVYLSNVSNKYIIVTTKYAV
jgi:hypothetical protein